MENILKAFGEWHCKVYLRQQFVCVSVFGDVWMDDFVFVFVYLFFFGRLSHRLKQAQV